METAILRSEFETALLGNKQYELASSRAELRSTISIATGQNIYICCLNTLLRAMAEEGREIGNRLPQELFPHGHEVYTTYENPTQETAP